MCTRLKLTCMHFRRVPYLLESGILVFEPHHVFDLLLLVLVAQQTSVSVRQLVQLLLVCPVLTEKCIPLCGECIQLFLRKHMINTDLQM